jgi:hypothetical protein
MFHVKPPDDPPKKWKPIKRYNIARPRFSFWYDHDPTIKREKEMDARDARDRGMGKALDAEHEAWKLKALLIALTIPDGWVGLFEEVRVYITSKGHSQPHVPQVWSALCGAWIKQGYFMRVDDWGQPVTLASHASYYRKIMRTAKPYTVKDIRRSSRVAHGQTSSQEPGPS